MKHLFIFAYDTSCKVKVERIQVKMEFQDIIPGGNQYVKYKNYYKDIIKMLLQKIVAL